MLKITKKYSMDYKLLNSVIRCKKNIGTLCTKDYIYCLQVVLWKPEIILV